MIDAHVHALRGDPQPLIDRLDKMDTRHFNVLGVPMLWGADNNLVCLQFKRLCPGRAWAFGGLHWDGRHCPRPEIQLERMMAAGFDGLKLLESKPDMQKRLGFAADSPAFEAMFALAEHEGIPILWHVGDPAPFWHLDQAPAFAVENGWTYEGEGFLSLCELYAQTEAVLARHPNLHIDLTPGSEMYRDFKADREGWQDFFRRYADRILLGSDTTNGEEAFWSQLGGLPRGLIKPEPFPIFEDSMQGFELDRAAYAAIAGGNFRRLAGESPKPINPEGLSALLDFYRENLPAAEVETIMESRKELLL